MGARSLPNLDMHGIGQSLVTDQDEESVLSDSYLDRHSNTVGSSIMWDRHTVHCSEEEQKLRTTECRDREGHKSSDKDRNRNHAKGNVRNPKRVNNQHQFRSASWMLPMAQGPRHGAYDCMALMANTRDCTWA